MTDKVMVEAFRVTHLSSCLKFFIGNPKALNTYGPRLEAFRGDE